MDKLDSVRFSTWSLRGEGACSAYPFLSVLGGGKSGRLLSQTRPTLATMRPSRRWGTRHPVLPRLGR